MRLQLCCHAAADLIDDCVYKALQHSLTHNIQAGCRGGSRVWKEGGHLAEKKVEEQKKKKKKGHNNNS